MEHKVVKLLLADDDEDDCLLFKEALNEMPIPTQLSVVHNGEQLLKVLQMDDDLPHILFLDLNMPRVNGSQCLNEVQKLPHLKQIRIVIFSTSYHQEIADELYEDGAMHYMQKPGDFEHLKILIAQVLALHQKESGKNNFKKKSKARKRNYVLSAIQNQS